MMVARPAVEWVAEGIPAYAPRTAGERAQDRYDRDFVVADIYTGIAYGHRLFGSGAAEGLYRTMSALLLSTAKAPATVLDLGCGVGRVVYDCAPVWLGTEFVAMDLSYNMCLRAAALLRGDQAVPLPALAGRGWPDAVFTAPRQLSNVTIAQGSAVDLPFAPLSFGVVMATLLLCRLPDPVGGLAQMVRVLRPGGRLLLATPCGFTTPEPWTRFVPPGALREHLAVLGLRVDEWMEDVPYREVIDAHGNAHEWRVRVIAATLTV